MAQSETASSPLAEALARVGDRWTLLVVEALLPGPLRFNELLDQIPGIAANILSDRLKRLEREGLLVARPYSERPPRAAYQLTAEGQELAGALRLLAYWGAGHADPALAPRQRIRVLRRVRRRVRPPLLPGLGGVGRVLRGRLRAARIAGRRRGLRAPAGQEAEQGDRGEHGSGHTSSGGGVLPI